MTGAAAGRSRKARAVTRVSVPPALRSRASGAVLRFAFSRGAGRGIAIASGSHGCTVYVAGRSQKEGDATLPGTIYETAEAVTSAGGQTLW